MKKHLATFFQVMVVVWGLAIIVFMLWEPNVEGRNANATLFEIYFKDPFLAYVYLGSIPFFVALYNAYSALGFVKYGQTFSPPTIKALRTIKYCALLQIGLILAGEGYLFITLRGKDDIAGGVAMGFFMVIILFSMALVAALVEKKLKKGMEVKFLSEPKRFGY